MDATNPYRSIYVRGLYEIFRIRRRARLVGKLLTAAFGSTYVFEAYYEPNILVRALNSCHKDGLFIGAWLVEFANQTMGLSLIHLSQKSVIDFNCEVNDILLEGGWYKFKSAVFQEESGYIVFRFVVKLPKKENNPVPKEVCGEVFFLQGCKERLLCEVGATATTPPRRLLKRLKKRGLRSMEKTKSGD